MAPRRLLSLHCAGQADLPALALWCQRFTPLTAPDPPDGVLLDITGCAHLFGGEAGLMAALAARLPGARMAVAGTAAAAWGLARYGEAGGETGSEARAENILPLPACGAAAGQPDHPQTPPHRGADRGGPQTPAARRAGGGLWQGTGFCGWPRRWAKRQRSFVSSLPRRNGGRPNIMRNRFLRLCSCRRPYHRLAAKLCGRLADATRGATALTARFYRIDRQCPAIALGFAAPCRDEMQISKLLIEKLAQESTPASASRPSHWRQARRSLSYRCSGTWRATCPIMLSR